MRIKHEMRSLISTIHSLIHLLISFRWETNCSVDEIDTIEKLRKAASDCFDELYKDVRYESK